MRLVRLKLEYTLDQLTDATLDLLRANHIREDTYIRPLAYAADTSGKRFAQIGYEAALLINTSPMPSHLKSGLTQLAKVSSWRRISEDVIEMSLIRRGIGTKKNPDECHRDCLS